MDTRQRPLTRIQQTGLHPSDTPIELQAAAVLLQADDDVAIARFPLSRGVTLRLPTG